MPFSELSFSAKPSHPMATLPAGITRSFIKTPGGDLEVLSAVPDDFDTTKIPIVFAHGGMGCAFVWNDYMLFFKKQGIPCYAVSYRGHGNSYHPSYLRMVFFTTKTHLAQDLLACIQHVSSLHSVPPMLVGHSSGGGLSQLILDRGWCTVSGLVLLGAVAGSGSWQTYVQWWKLDPWFNLRMYAHLMHPNSPLSSNALVKAVFFSPSFPDEKVTEFRKHSATYEALWWPVGMMLKFVNYKKVLLGIRGWEKKNSDRLLVAAGGKDVIMPIWIEQKMARGYREAMKQLVERKKVEKGEEDYSSDEKMDEEESRGMGIRHYVIGTHNHHTQNEEDWELGAEKILRFCKQL